MSCRDPLEDGGLLLTFSKPSETFRIEHFRVSIKGDLIEMWVHGNFKTGIDEAIQYLTPLDAMALSKSLRSIAIRAFEDAA